MSSLDFQRRKIEPGFKGKAGFDAGLSCFSYNTEHKGSVGKCKLQSAQKVDLTFFDPIGLLQQPHE